jgi:hypothetical protein
MYIDHSFFLEGGSMNHEREVSPFACVEPDCEGVVDPLSESITKLDPSDYSARKAVACPQCGRLYGEDNLPVLSDDYMKAFAIPGGVANRPLTAVEKYNLIRGSFDGMQFGGSFEARGTYRRRIIALCGGDDIFFDRRKSRKGHSDDCAAVTEKAVHMCTCGVLYARNWFRDHGDDLAGDL